MDGSEGCVLWGVCRCDEPHCALFSPTGASASGRSVPSPARRPGRQGLVGTGRLRCRAELRPPPRCVPPPAALSRAGRRPAAGLVTRGAAKGPSSLGVGDGLPCVRKAERGTFAGSWPEVCVAVALGAEGPVPRQLSGRGQAAGSVVTLSLRCGGLSRGTPCLAPVVSPALACKPPPWEFCPKLCLES